MNKGNIKGVNFDEEKHSYTYQGRTLKGVTGAIAKKLGKSFPDTVSVALACSYGSQVHKEVERWINDKTPPVLDKGQWLVGLLQKMQVDESDYFTAETRVSDFEGTASNVDIVLHRKEGVVLFDIKTGKFDREYCTLQLNSYRLMYENCYSEKVIAMSVLGTKYNREYTILKCDDEIILKLLEENK